jgi:hypothetical protein
MKKPYKIFTACFLIVMMAVVSCNKDIAPVQSLKTFQPSSVDANAGTWKPLLLTSNSQIAVAAPAAVTSAAYLAEIQAIKDLQSTLTSDQRKAIEYWSVGGVLRWNEIFRGLVAQYNLPPAPLANWTYPAPDAENPFADPNFPFANPPYASRAYSYAAGAQYDALKAAWYWKDQYKRPAPYNVDPGVQSLMTKSTLPSYPSEDAVMSGVNAEVLKLMFPAAVDIITRKAGEQRNAALWSGKATTSDIAAGLALGKAVATVFTDRAKTDGMGTAGGNKTQWQALADNATSRGEIPWQSLETPARPPMLPFFGLRSFGPTTLGVKAWMMTNTDIVNGRPAPPPPTGSAEMKKEVDEVKYYADNVTRERLAIVHKWADGAGTYTPSGHWNEIASRYIENANMSEVRAARAFALLNVALHDAAICCWETKYFYFNPRPSQMDPSIKTVTGVPNFPAYTSGHSTFSGAAATVLGYLFPSDAQFFSDQATEASMSRLYGGIHYRSDCNVGLQSGQKVGAFTVNFAVTDGAN